MRCRLDKDIDDKILGGLAITHGFAGAACGPKENAVALTFGCSGDGAD